MRRTLLSAALVMACGALSAPAMADFVTLPTTGQDVMTSCSPAPTCRVRVMPGSNPGGYVLLNARRSNIVVNSVTVGKVLDRVWKKPFANTYVFATRVILNDQDWGSGFHFQVDDIFRYGFSSTAQVDAGWRNARVGDQAIDQVGRTSVGLNEGEKLLNLGVVDFFSPLFVDITEPGEDDDDDEDVEEVAGGEDEDETIDTGSPKKARTAWYYVRTTANGYQLGSHAIRLWNGGDSEGQTPTSVWFSGFKPVYGN